MRLSLELEKVSLVNGGQGQLVPEWEVRSGQWGWSGQWCQGWGGGNWDWTGGRTTSSRLRLVICAAPWRWHSFLDSELGRDCWRGTWLLGWVTAGRPETGWGEMKMA